MKTNDFLNAFSGIDEKFQLEADTALNRAHLKKNRMRFALIAASLTLLISMIPIFFLVGDYFKPTPSTNSPTTVFTPSTPLPPKASILDISGAISQNDVLNSLSASAFSTPVTSTSQVFAIEDMLKWCAQIRENYSSVLGTVLKSETILLKDDTLSYSITVLTVSVEERYYHAEKTPDTIRLIYAAPIDTSTHPNTKYNEFDRILPEYRYDEFPNYSAYPYNVGVFASVYRHGICLFEDIKDRTITVGGTVYRLSDYADYYLPLWLANFNMPGNQYFLSYPGHSDQYHLYIKRSYFFGTYQLASDAE